MYDRFRGVLLEKGATRAVLEVCGIGYDFTIPLSTFEDLPGQGEEATVHAHLHVREDSLRLFGFASSDERRFFRRLLDVQGIGPAVALSILSSSRYEEFRDAVVSENVGLLTRLKGVGRKLAQRMILDLKDALEKEDRGAPRVDRSGLSSVREDGIAALVTLGFGASAARREVDRILAGSEKQPDVGEIVRQALGTSR